MSETDTPDDNQISDDDWAAAMQEQAAAEGLTDTAEPAMGDESPFQAKPASQLFPDFGQAGAKGGLSRDRVMACAQDQAGVDAMNARIEANLREHDGIGSTPTFVINGRMLVGEQTLAQLDAVIQPLLRGRR